MAMIKASLAAFNHNINHIRILIYIFKRYIIKLKQKSLQHVLLHCILIFRIGLHCKTDELELYTFSLSEYGHEKCPCKRLTLLQHIYTCSYPLIDPLTKLVPAVTLPGVPVVSFPAVPDLVVGGSED